MTDSLRGRLLVAMPALEDGNFDRSVVFLLEHGPDGALGLVLNRPVEAELEAPLDRWADSLTEPAALFVGGPVEPQALIALGRAQAELPSDHLAAAPGGLVTVDLTADPAIVTPELRDLRLFVGYAGWSGGQLEGELELGAWIVADAADDDALTHDPDGLWRRVLGRQHGQVSWLRDFPDDPILN